jgi:hypothetical protein
VRTAGQDFERAAPLAAQVAASRSRWTPLKLWRAGVIDVAYTDFESTLGLSCMFIFARFRSICATRPDARLRQREKFGEKFGTPVQNQSSRGRSGRI